MFQLSLAAHEHINSEKDYYHYHIYYNTLYFLSTNYLVIFCIVVGNFSL